MQSWGDVDEVFKYQKIAQSVEDKLTLAMDRIDKMNEEEAAFKWDTTQYPLRKEIANRLGPYKKLYDASCEFLSMRDKWLASMLGLYHPEDIDNDVSVAYR